MVNKVQSDFLESLIGIEGVYTEVIRETTSINLGTKILYLERALSWGPHDFYTALGKLYRAGSLELIRSLKMICDLFWNNEIEYGEYGLRHALTHYFQSLGPIDQEAFQLSMQRFIFSQIDLWLIGHEESVSLQKRARIQAEEGLDADFSWYDELKENSQRFVTDPTEWSEGSASLEDSRVGEAYSLEPIDGQSHYSPDFMEESTNTSSSEMSERHSIRSIQRDEAFYTEEEPRLLLSNGQFIVASWVGENGFLRVYRNDWHFLYRFSQNEEDVRGMVELPGLNGNYLAVGSYRRDGHIRIYHLLSGRLVRSFEQDNASVDGMAVLPNGNLLVGGIEANEPIRIYEPHTGALVQRFEHLGESARYIKVLANTSIAVAGLNTPISLYNFETGELIGWFSSHGDLLTYDAFLYRLEEIFSPELLEAPGQAILMDDSFNEDNLSEDSVMLQERAASSSTAMSSLESAASFESPFRSEELREANDCTAAVTTTCYQKTSFFCTQSNQRVEQIIKNSCVPTALNESFSAARPQPTCTETCYQGVSFFCTQMNQRVTQTIKNSLTTSAGCC